MNSSFTNWWFLKINGSSPNITGFSSASIWAFNKINWTRVSSKCCFISLSLAINSYNRGKRKFSSFWGRRNISLTSFLRCSWTISISITNNDSILFMRARWSITYSTTFIEFLFWSYTFNIHKSYRESIITTMVLSIISRTNTIFIDISNKSSVSITHSFTSNLSTFFVELTITNRSPSSFINF